jgi:hypothetical protein
MEVADPSETFLTYPNGVIMFIYCSDGCLVDLESIQLA